MAALAVADLLAALGTPAVGRAAQLADHDIAVEEVDAFADQRRAPAVRAARPAGRQRTDALAQELALEIGFRKAEDGSEHANGFAVRSSGPPPSVSGFSVCCLGIAGSPSGPIRPRRNAKRPDRQAIFRAWSD
jgi:hypothetical protein